MKPNMIQIPIGHDDEFDEANVTLFMEVDQITGLGTCWYGSEDGFTLNVGKVTEDAGGKSKIEVIGHYEGDLEEQRAEFQKDFGYTAPAPPTIH